MDMRHRSIWNATAGLGLLALTSIFGCDTNGSKPPSTNTNQAPTVELTANPKQGQAPLETRIQLHNANDPDGDVSLYQLDLNGDGDYNDKQDIEQTTPIDITRAFNNTTTINGRVKDNQGKPSSEQTETITVNDNDTTAPNLNLDAQEGSDYGTVNVTATTNEPANLTIYVVNQAGTDSTRILQQNDTERINQALNVLHHELQPNETARLSATATDTANNQANETAQATIEGHDLEGKILEATTDPSKRLIALPDVTLYVTNQDTEETRTTQTDTDGTYQLTNLTEGPVEIYITEDNQDGTIGTHFDWKEQTTIDADKTLDRALWQHIEGDTDPYQNNLDAFLEQTVQLSNWGPGKPNNATGAFKIYVNPDSAGTGTPVSQSKIDAVKQNILTANGPNEQGNNVTFTSNQASAQYILRFTDVNAIERYQNGNQGQIKLNAGLTVEGSLDEIAAHEATSMFTIVDTNGLNFCATPGCPPERFTPKEYGNNEQAEDLINRFSRDYDITNYVFE